MGTINEVKQLAETDTPLLFFQCVLPSGDIENWCTHSITYAGQTYSARVLKHNLFDLQLSADDAMDGISQLSVTLANADSALSELNAGIGFKGAQLTVYFAFADVQSLIVTTETTVLFKGIAGDPDEITEDTFTLSFINKLSLQRIPLPDVRIQRACPWNFPTNQLQRMEATDGGVNGQYSRFYRCGYSADVPGGVGNLNAGQPFTSCDLSRTECQQRGMFDSDAQAHVTRRFGGFEFVPSAIMVRTSGDKTSHLSPLLSNSAKYNDAVPIVYGTGWLKAPVIFSRNDGNLTHMEVLLGMGTIQNVLKVVVNDVEIPQAVSGQNMTATGWYNVFTLGNRQGSFNLDFTDSNGDPLGDPYGSMSAASVVVPNRISSGRSLPNVEVLLQGMQLDSYAADGTPVAHSFTNNPAWVVLDILRRCGWSLSDLDLTSFSSAAEFCGTLITTTDLNGNTIQVPRFECNLILTKRQSAATVVRGIRVASSLMLRYGPTGLLQLVPETTLAAQQPTMPDGGNSTEPLNGGWPAYEFSDASGPFSGIVRASNGGSTVRLTSRSIAETSNRLSVEFQDESNEYQQDSLTVVDAQDAGLIGYEISSQSTALGIANFSQANRVLLRQLDKSTKGNQFVQFQTSFRALKVRPGDIITLTYLKEGFTRVPLRIMKLSPSVNYQLVTILAQIHDDDWYSDDPSVLGGAGRQANAQNQVPRPLIGLIPHTDAEGQFEYFDFTITESIQAQTDGSATDILTVSYSQPTKPNPNIPNLPLVSLSPQYDATGGSIAGGSNLYYAVTAVDETGNEGALSFTIPAIVPAGTDTNVISITDLSFPRLTAAFNVYRGTSPQMLYQIAKQVELSSSYTDTGAPPLPVGPPDASFDHANFYYRFEYAGPFVATTFSSTTIGSADMGAASLAYSGMVVRIIDGRGMGQERGIATNDLTTLTVTQVWSILPDATSTFVIAEASWKFAAVSATSTVQFEVPYSAGTVIQVSGRGANVSNQEGAAELCPLTRWPLGGGKPDTGIPSPPLFSLAVPGGGNVTVFGISFNDLSNTSSITTGTLQLFSWSEVGPSSPLVLSMPLDAGVQTITLNEISDAQTGDTIQVGDIVQVDSELMTVVSVDPNTTSCGVIRGALNSQAAPHLSGETVLHLQSSILILPFARDFFQNKASNNYVHTASLPDIRIAGAQLYVTNSFGDSQAAGQSYAAEQDGGLRTLSGGQFSLQVSGYIATQQNAAPPLIIESSHAVRDIRATLSEAAQGYIVSVTLSQNGLLYGGDLSLPSGALTSNVLDGVSLPPLAEGGTITLNVNLSPDATYQGSSNPTPGRDLTVTIRL